MRPEENPERERRNTPDAYRFSPPGVLRKAEMQTLRRLNRNLPALIGASTAEVLPGGLEVELEKLEQGGWERALEQLSGSPVGCVFSAQPAGYSGMLTMERSLAASCVNGALAQEREDQETKSFTELETRVFLRVVATVVDVLPRVWQGMGEFEVTPEKYLDDPRGAAPLAGDRNFVHFGLSAHCGDGEARLVLSFPSPPLRRLVAPEMESGSDGDKDVARRAERAVKRTPLEIRVVLGRAELRPAELLGLEEGDVVMLDAAPEDLLEVQVEGTGKLLGEPGVHKGRKAARIRRIKKE